ncbi:glycerate kinase [Mucilaginibacter corticis]|uniref:Glycerate kinase n=1 Tax=Mucilaginibacter corticis TaxID=2597670 RepID=A0A556MU59_9SPHI|nr:glycerate kinase [Mucilaginibacter corticis]TSJ43385.1 glycerate kinase [Mucilaginibacter corticis]
MNILIAPNAFKNSLDAQSVAEAIALGLQQSKADCKCQLFPVGDGGDGTGELLVKHLNGERIEVQVHDALGRPITSHFGLVDDGRTAIIEMADASGLRLLRPSELNPLYANSYGTGELIKAALDKGVNKIIVGMGGSATVDGGAGILQALGIRFINVDDEVVTGGPSSFSELKHIDTMGLDKRILNCEISILCDVDNKLTGPEGAAAIFGPQKGADQIDVMLLDSLLLWFATIQAHQTGRDIINLKHGGTAGGAAAGMFAFLNAKLIPGADNFLKLAHFDEALKNADLVITGEGSIDEQTLHGKAPAAVAMAAKQKGIKVIGVAGKVPEDTSAALNQYFDRLISINKAPVDLETALKNTRQNLIATGKEIGDSIADA